MVTEQVSPSSSSVMSLDNQDSESSDGKNDNVFVKPVTDASTHSSDESSQTSTAPDIDAEEFIFQPSGEYIV